MSGIKKVGVLGCGLMGSGIAQTAATAGFTTVARDVGAPLLEKGRGGILKSLGRLVEKGKIEASARDAASGRLSFTTDLDALRDCDIIIEAVTEDLELKNRLWKELDKLCPAQTIFASNTSSLTIAAMAAATRRPDRFVGLHFFNPVPLMPLVEVVRTVTTSQETFDRAYAFATGLGKEPVAANDSPGFIVNLLLVPFLLDAARALERGVASIPDLDRAMQLGCGHPMGPLTLLDYIGLDTVVRISEIMFDAYREPRYAAPPLLQRMVIAGFHGKKNGRGFYDYSVDPPVPSELGLGTSVNSER
jgi:3-hydroxybutyryl-CoA dehydrogenase